MGKSTLAAMTIRHLQQIFLVQSCQHHFFTGAQPTKKSLAYCLRSIAFQVATTHGLFAERLLRLHHDVGDALSSDGHQTIWAKVFEGILFKIDVGYTLNWVFDAVDEAENPQMLLKLVSQLQTSPDIKVMLLSRPNTYIDGMVGQWTESAIVETLKIQDTAHDIWRYTRSVVSATFPTEGGIQTRIIDQIVSRTEGSFIWARLILDTLNDDCHTLEDIQKAMDVVPREMQSSYRKMLSSVRSQSLPLQNMAQRILTWATCSLRPIKLAELQAALEPEFGDFTSLKDTVIQVCGHLVRLDGDNVSLIHATAQTFLTTPDLDEPEFISWQEGHEALAKACLRYLSADRWRSILSRVSETGLTHKDRLAVLYDNHPLLRYALTNWPYHVRNARVTSLALLQHLNVFFSKHVLCWIQAVALSRSFHILPLTSQCIKFYLKKRNEGQSSSLTSPNQSGEVSDGNDVLFLERWAVDLVRILARFGHNLAENPSSIFKHIPPFCPRDSIMSQFAASREKAVIQVTGLSSQIWDDNLARVSIGESETSSKVRSAGVCFLTLISYNGTVIIWSAETYEELRRLEHGESVTLLETNATGRTAATSGRLNFKIWDISSGQLLHAITRDPELRPVQIAFGDVETDFVVAYDTCLVVWHDMQTGNEVRRFTAEQCNKLRGCPRLTALSPDQSRVAIAFRGQPVSVWETSGTSSISPRQCLRAVDGTRASELDPYSISQATVWHPDGESLYILYFDAVLVHWDLVNDETTEFGHTEARGMAISSDGAFLATCTSNGVLSVWGLPAFHLVYQLHGKGPVYDMAFSPDSRRIYTTKSSLCCVWEPDALIRPDGIDPDGNGLGGTEDESLASRVVPEPVYFQESNGSDVTALIYEGGGEFYCCGREDGTVSIHSMKTGQIARKVSSHGVHSDVVTLAWSPSGKFLVSGDDMGKVIVKKLRIKEDETWAVYPVFETITSEGFADQFVFSRDERFVLISAPLQDQVWDLAAKSKVWAGSREKSRSGQWINHPADESRLLLIEQNLIHIHQWQKLEEHLQIIITVPNGIEAPQPTPENISDRVQCLVETNSRCYLVCQTLPENGNKLRFRNNSGKGLLLLSLLQTSDFQGLASTPEKQVRRRPLFDLSSHVQRFLGCHRGMIVFIDHANWYVLMPLASVCSPSLSRRCLCQRPRRSKAHVSDFFPSAPDINCLAQC